MSTPIACNAVTAAELVAFLRRPKSAFVCLPARETLAWPTVAIRLTEETYSCWQDNRLQVVACVLVTAKPTRDRLFSLIGTTLGQEALVPDLLTQVFSAPQFANCTWQLPVMASWHAEALLATLDPLFQRDLEPGMTAAFYR